MEKKYIKQILREALDIIGEAKEEKKKRNIKKDYVDIQNAFKKELSPSQVGVMKDALGWDDDEDGIKRSLFGKMLHQDKNDDGSYYQFNDKQLAKIRTSLNLK
jgi:hypothetical protein